MKLYGRAAVGNLSGSITWSTLGANSEAAQTSRKATYGWDEKVKLLNPSTGEPIGFGITEERQEFTLEFIPVSDGSSGKNTKAIAKGAIKKPAPYALVTVSGYPDSDWDGTYNFVGGWDVQETQDGYCKVSMNVRKYIHTDSDPTKLATEVTS